LVAKAPSTHSVLRYLTTMDSQEARTILAKELRRSAEHQALPIKSRSRRSGTIRQAGISGCACISMTGAFAPLTDDFIVGPNGSFVGE